MILWHNWLDPAQVVGGYATAAAAGIALVALLAAAFQVIAAQWVSREAGALQAYREYLKLCFENPGFSSYDMFRQLHPQDLKLLDKGGMSETSEKYLWFVSILLSSCEEILLNVSSKGEWRATLITQLSYHAGTLEIMWPKQKDNFDKRLSPLVEEAIRNAG